MKKILFLAANPVKTDHLELDQEAKEIKKALGGHKMGDDFQLITEWAVSIDDLRNALLYEKPQIVHFSGHGIKNKGLHVDNNLGDMQPQRDAVILQGQPGGIVLQDDSGNAQPVRTDALAKLFSLCKAKIECVLLNACYSEEQAEAIFKHIDSVIGMQFSIRDNAAIKFSKGFYDAISAGYNYEVAFEIGKNNIALHNIPQDLVPIIKFRPSSISHNSNNKELTQDDIEIFTDILIRSGRAEHSARRPLCIKIGIDPNELGFLRQSTDANFALELITDLHSRDDRLTLFKLCKELEPFFKRGKYAPCLENLQQKLNCQ
ncbi:CHAT domain-containing protein [Microcoleus sp. S36b_A4]|uniref:CHAT domain-containing protein n=1 Tax=Microcoleus sp. S36b_A4 TaxID=3055420 RepID=UPI002FCED6D3